MMVLFLFLLILLVDTSWALEMASRPVRKVAVIGAGISGLSVAHALHHCTSAAAAGADDDDNNQSIAQGFDVSIFDTRSKFDTTAGAGIQLNGGLVALNKINPALRKAVAKAGLPQTRVQSRAKSWFAPASQKQFDTLLALDLKETVQSASEDIAKALIGEDGELMWISIMRGALQEALLDNLPQGQKVTFGKSLQRIVSSQDEGAMCEFTDGSMLGPFDLIVGCDGIRSVVKDFVDNTSSSSSTSSNTIYSGIRIRYAVEDGDPKAPVEETATLTQYFGDGAYALSGIYGAGPNKPNSKCSFIVYLDENYIGPFRIKEKRSDSVTVGENADWTQDVRQNASKQSMLKQLEDCGIPDRDNSLSSVITNADRFFELGVYFHNPFSQWCRPISDNDKKTPRAYAVLCGDAAHALPPFLGQGSNQAIQDAYCLVTKICEYNQQFSKNGNEDIKSLKAFLNDYQHIRSPKTFNIFWKSVVLGYLETGGNQGLYSKFRDVFFKTMGMIGVAKKVLLGAATPKLK